jgi:type II secretory ATPase GspE/PulE/Tfp pilus assembly ATPase PilB-like protein
LRVGENVPVKKDPQPSEKKALLVEDNFFMAQLIQDKLSQQGFSITHAATAKEGLDSAKKDSPSLIILDVPLGKDHKCYELIEQLRKETGSPIFALFDKKNDKREKECIKRGVTKFLIKQNTALVDIVAGALELTGQTVPAPKRPAKEKTKRSKEEEPAKAPVDLVDAAGATPQETQKVKEHIEKLLSRPESEISIIALVDNLMSYAFLTRASDIHLEPFEDGFLARMRIDGILHDMFTLPKGIQPGIISRIKVLGAMRTDEHQAAQDGRFRMSMKNPERQFDVRVSIVPTYYGENAVLRLLAEQTKLNSLDDLTFSDEDRAKVRGAVQTPYGMILATGPTGSGKTTTLYTILKELSTREVSIITIEDPIEYSLEGIDQIQVNTRTGLTFATGLRSILRQDPNVIMVGEIRDEETASIAVNAALTGHKLLSTLHTNDAATTLPRLLDMGVEPFLVASTVNVAIGQRLLRMICQNCKEPRRITEGEFESLKSSIPPETLGSHRDFFAGKGCPECGESGYKGRMGIYEILEMNDFVREAVMRHADAGEVKKIAVKNGMTTLIDDGFQKALKGLTTIEELLRVVHE